jgi:hypothetical protein
VKVFLNPPNVKTPCPITQIVAVIIITILGPFESIIMPPSKGITIFGIEYNEYNKLKVVYPNSSPVEFL